MLKKLILAAAGLALAVPAFAHDGGRGWGHYRQPHFHPRPVVMMPAPRVFYAPPAPVYYAPPPVVYRPAPVYAPVYPAPLPPSGVSIRLNFPL
jgi:hypothetical protein